MFTSTVLLSMQPVSVSKMRLLVWVDTMGDKDKADRELFETLTRGVGPVPVVSTIFPVLMDLAEELSFSHWAGPLFIVDKSS